MSPHCGNRSGNRGLTLVELLVASVLLGTVLVVLVQGVSLAVRTASEAHREAVALQLAETLVARLRAGELVVGTDADGDFEAEGEPTYRWTVTNETLEGLFRVNVAVAWPSTAGESSLDLAVLLRAPAEDTQ